MSCPKYIEYQIKFKFFLIALLLLGVRFSSVSQSLNVSTSIASGIHNFVFYEPYIDANRISVFALNPFVTYSAFEFRIYDHDLNFLIRKPFTIYNDSLAALCGTTPNAKTLMSNKPMNYYPDPVDSSIYVLTNLYHDYGGCNAWTGSTLFKFTNNFDTIWNRQYSIFGNGSILFNDSTLLVHSNNQLMCLKLFNGDTLWVKQTYATIERSMKSFSDSTVILFGRGAFTNTCGYVRELSSSGNMLWGYSVCDSTINQFFLQGVRTIDSCYVFLSLRNPNTTSAHLGLIKVDRLGNIIWDKVYTYNLAGYYGFPNGLYQTPDGNYLITYDSYHLPQTYHSLMKVDSNGNIIWNKKFMGTNYACQSNLLYKIFPLSSNQLLVTGGNLLQMDISGYACFFNSTNYLTASNGNSVLSMVMPYIGPIPTSLNWKYNMRSNRLIFQSTPELSHLDSCIIPTSVSDHDPEKSVVVYPNPVHSILTIQVKRGVGKNISLYLYNVYGQKIRTIFYDENSGTDVSKTIDVSDLSSGIYFIKAGNATNSVKRFVKY